MSLHLSADRAARARQGASKQHMEHWRRLGRDVGVHFTAVGVHEGDCHDRPKF